MENKFQELLESTKYTPLAASDSAMMSLMLENTEKETARLVAEGTLSGDVAQFTPILMPMVRRVYPNLIANELLGVQPMSMSTGYIYALTNQYIGQGNEGISPLTTGDSAYALTSQVVVIAATGLGLAIGDVVGTDADGDNNADVVKYVEEQGSNTVILIGGAGYAKDDVLKDDTSGTASTIGTITATFSNEASFGKIFKNYTGKYTTAQAEQLGADMKEVGFSISKKSVEAKSRALKGRYTVEMYQDLKSQHGLLADEEIMSLMSYEMQAEIDREIVDFVNNTATLVSDTAYAPFTGTNTDGRWEIEKYRVEAIRLAKESAQIGLDTKRGNGNILVVSPKVATMLEQVGSFKTATQTSGVNAPISGGVAGTFDGKYKVIVDQYAASDYATVMYKGADRRDAMGFFAPYVPMSFTKVTDYESGQPAVIAKTRYALDTIPGIENAQSTDRASKYARTYGISFADSVLA